ncbi:hypothetical protein CQW23_23616 [Capsicum baccatum]|uniref:Histidine kinase/HSP90-like ATPase domain-containing protein n=1 Tax=Capsicum baccatum TaxID=33114 RepID=A0A2G2VSH4_CAPBA|nr:hypothetical protein CQW23_23616 [Capsicum baccatum]
MAVNGLMVMVAVGFNAVARMLNLNVNFMKGRDHVNNSMHRFLGVTDLELLKEAVDLNICIQIDKDNGLITITDLGIGMTHQELVYFLGTIAQSGTAKFVKALKVEVDNGLPCGSFWA